MVGSSEHVHFAQTCTKKFPRNPYTVTNIDDVWEMDLAYLSSLSKYDKYKYLLNVIHIFSRYVWSVPVKDKTGTSITTALKSLFQNRKPITIQSDKGTELVNSSVQQYLKRQGVSFHTTHNPDIQGAIIERFNRTLKTRMFKYFTKNNIQLFKCHKQSFSGLQQFCTFHNRYGSE